MNTNIIQLFPFVFVFVFVLAQDGHAKTPLISNMQDVVQNLEEYYIPQTPKSLQLIPIKNYQRGPYSISFKIRSKAIRIEWDKSAKFIQFNGFKFNKKSLKNSYLLKKKVSQILGREKRRYSLFIFLIPQAHAMNQNMSQVLAYLLRRIMSSLVAINQYQAPIRAQNYTTPIQSNTYSETTQVSYGQNSIFSQPLQASAPTVTPQQQVTHQRQVRRPTTTPAAAPSSSCPSGYDSLECQVVTLTNQHRRRNGKAPLTVGADCTQLAESHANDMSSRGFFSHTSPTQGSFRSRAQKFQIQGGGENIASGQRSAEKVMQDWIRSPGHNQNLLRSSFTKIGVSRVGNEWVQCFSR